MPERPVLPWTPALTRYDFGPGHPMAPVRLTLTLALLAELGLLDPAVVEVIEPAPADPADLALVHEPAYVAAVRLGERDPDRGLGAPDNPVFPDMHAAASLVVGATLAGARAVAGPAPRRAVSLAGGLHHGMPGHASGFCIYNDLAVAIRRLVADGARVAYLDLDAHHGDGVERIFWNEPRVLTVSVHQDPRTLFPGTGRSGDVGGPGAPGSAVNVPLPPGAGDAAYLRALDGVAVPVIAEFAPDVLVSQHGCDGHRRDPLTDLTLTVDGQAALAGVVAGLADSCAGGRWLATGGGGYAVADVVPRAWAHLVAIAAGAPIPPETPTPEGWRTAVRALGFEPPERMTDGAGVADVAWRDGYDPDNPVDRAILTTRIAVFPWHGLDAYSSW